MGPAAQVGTVAGEASGEPSETRFANTTEKPEADPVAAPPAVIQLEPLRIQVVGGSKDDPEYLVYDARGLLDAGNEHLAENRIDDALAQYDRLLRDFPDSRLVVAALYNAGLAHEAKGDIELALERYRQLIRQYPKGRDSVDAHVRMGAVLADLERWTAALTLFEELLARTDLSASDRIEGMARMAYVLIEQKDYGRAEKILEESIRYYQSTRLTEHLDTDYFVSMAHYYLGEIPHRQSLAIPLRVEGQEQLKKDLKAKADLIVLAYDRFHRALKLHHPYWATASGYQMSHMYKEFWDALVLAPIPPHLDTESAGFYVEAVHEQARTFLEKALHGHSKNVELAEAFKATTPWSSASRVHATQIAGILARETSGELVTPRRRDEHVPEPGTHKIIAPDRYVPGRVDL